MIKIKLLLLFFHSLPETYSCIIWTFPLDPSYGEAVFFSPTSPAYLPWEPQLPLPPTDVALGKPITAGSVFPDGYDEAMLVSLENTEHILILENFFGEKNELYL